MAPLYNTQALEIKKMIDKVDVNCSDYDKRTPLHLASAEGKVEVVKFL